MKLRFLGCGNASATENFESAAVLEMQDSDMSVKYLCIDYGKDAHVNFHRTYRCRPHAIFITHTHFDHIGGLEALFFDQFLQPHLTDKIKLMVPVPIISSLYNKVVTEQHQVAEGGVNFFDYFQLVPVMRGFWFASHYFSIFEARHFAPQFCYGLTLPGKFLYTADSKPIPEVITHYACAGGFIFHDVSLHNNPAHASIDELMHYPLPIRSRMWLYHYQDNLAVSDYEQQGFNFVKSGMVFDLTTQRLMTPACLQDSSLPKVS